eukprot:GHVP01059606.1.p1 GENE.GHVP01059606.1~~GHVP01059606.1.p1  ORF type:complete len:836 (+),score=126.87 GHVP01059606.1:3-2510(+)
MHDIMQTTLGSKSRSIRTSSSISRVATAPAGFGPSSVLASFAIQFLVPDYWSPEWWSKRRRNWEALGRDICAEIRVVKHCSILNLKDKVLTISGETALSVERAVAEVISTFQNSHSAFGVDANGDWCLVLLLSAKAAALMQGPTGISIQRAMKDNECTWRILADFKEHCPDRTDRGRVSNSGKAISIRTPVGVANLAKVTAFVAGFYTMYNSSLPPGDEPICALVKENTKLEMDMRTRASRGSNIRPHTPNATIVEVPVEVKMFLDERDAAWIIGTQGQRRKDIEVSTGTVLRIFAEYPGMSSSNRCIVVLGHSIQMVMSAVARILRGLDRTATAGAQHHHQQGDIVRVSARPIPIVIPGVHLGAILGVAGDTVKEIEAATNVSLRYRREKVLDEDEKQLDIRGECASILRAIEAVLVVQENMRRDSERLGNQNTRAPNATVPANRPHQKVRGRGKDYRTRRSVALRVSGSGTQEWPKVRRGSVSYRRSNPDSKKNAESVGGMCRHSETSLEEGETQEEWDENELQYPTDPPAKRRRQTVGSKNDREALWPENFGSSAQYDSSRPDINMERPLVRRKGKKQSRKWKSQNRKDWMTSAEEYKALWQISGFEDVVTSQNQYHLTIALPKLFTDTVGTSTDRNIIRAVEKMLTVRTGATVRIRVAATTSRDCSAVYVLQLKGSPYANALAVLVVHEIMNQGSSVMKVLRKLATKNDSLSSPISEYSNIDMLDKEADKEDFGEHDLSNHSIPRECTDKNEILPTVEEWSLKGKDEVESEECSSLFDPMDKPEIDDVLQFENSRNDNPVEYQQDEKSTFPGEDEVIITTHVEEASEILIK